MWPARQSHQISDADSLEASIVDDENFVEWDFRVHGNAAGGASVCLPGLHADSSQFHCCLRGHVISPPVLSDFSSESSPFPLHYCAFSMDASHINGDNIHVGS